MFGIDDAVSAVATIGGKLIDRFIPDPAVAAQAKLDLLKMQQTGELARLTADTDLMKSQLAVNQVEASSTNLFVSGWRPFIGWVCGFGLATQLEIGPLFTWAQAWIDGNPVQFPSLDSSTLTTVLFAMLGIGGYRSIEKIMGVKSHEPSDGTPPSTAVNG